MNGIEYKYISQYKENEILKVKNSLLKMEKDFKQLKQREKYGMQKLKELEDNVRSFKFPNVTIYQIQEIITKSLEVKQNQENQKIISC